MPSNQLLSSKIVFDEQAPSGRSVPSFNTCVVGFLGVTEKGPIGVATLLMNFNDYKRIFGGYTAESDLAACVEGFFLSGGSMCYVTRTVHFTDATDPDTKTSAAALVSISTAGGSPTATLKIHGKYDGAYANALKAQIADATSGDADKFNLYVVDAAGLRKESWPNLSMNPAHARYVLKVINNAKTGSALISAEDLAPSVTTDRPANGSYSLATGSNGLTGLVDADYAGSQAGWTGLYSFDKVSDLTVLAVPGVATAAVHLAMVSYCEIHRSGQVFAVLDPPEDLDYSEIVTYVDTTASLENLSEFGALYWPRIKVANPNTAIYGDDDTITIPPSGDICGVIARTDNSRAGGVWEQPAGTETGKFARVLGFETDDVLSEDVRDLVFPHRINPLTTEKGLPKYIDGARTLKGDGSFPSVGQRRGVSFCERTIRAAVQPLRHGNNNVDRRAECQRTVDGFLLTQTKLGAFATKIPQDAYFVDFSDALQVSPKIIDGAWGVATTEPAEFIRMKVSQDTRAADAAARG